MAGIITVPLENQPKFRELLINIYETNHMDEIKGFIYEECIDGIPFENTIEYDNEPENDEMEL